MSIDWQERTEAELADSANSAMQGQGAIIEMMRRLTAAITAHAETTNDLNKSTNTLIKGLWIILAALLIATAILVGIALRLYIG